MSETEIQQHIVERIINLLDIEKKVEMYENGMLKEMTTDARVIEKWENEVYTYYYNDTFFYCLIFKN